MAHLQQGEYEQIPDLAEFEQQVMEDKDLFNRYYEISKFTNLLERNKDLVQKVYEKRLAEIGADDDKIETPEFVRQQEKVKEIAGEEKKAALEESKQGESLFSKIFSFARRIKEKIKR